ncbi:uncharacterized protein BYT42DRAFT_546712 [Radiomyces spectabilis]|uniref:uncharacterized protein n=1 Tax=Radiomyces spectabilis TaxID=64574 RepID=UPI002220DE9B|nr:uncharacterized protein BYT42DRAFT_546712 [Radiomyces spectabilis]KAI8375978.1 hypothetical protein BYT42DRAFT_546712 [Radiomyces spectabilis]
MAPKRDDSPLKSQGAWTASKVGLATKPTRRSSRPGSTVKPSKAPSSVTSSAHLSVDEPLPKPPSSIASIKDNSTVNGNDSVSHPYAKEPTFDHMPGVGPINYTSMIQQLSFSYAVMVASHYPTVSIDEAELLKEQYEHARSMLARLRTRIRFETSIQRGTTTVLKCAMADEVYLEELRSNSVHIEQLVDELYYGFERANELQAQYLQHVAGTLSSTPTTLPEPHHGDQRLKPDYDHLLARLQSITQKYVKVPPCGSYGGITKAGARMNSVSDDGSISGDSVFSKSVRTSVTSMDAELYYHGLATHDHLLDMIEKRLAESRLVSEGSARHQEVQTVALPLTVNDDKKQVDKWQKNEASIVAKCTQVLNKDEPAALSAIQAVDQLIERVMQWRENYDQQLDELRQQTQRDTETISKCEQTIRTQQEQIVQLKQTCSDLRAERAEYESKYLRLEEMQNNSVSLLEKQLQEMKTDCAVKGQELLKLNGFLKDAQEQFTLRESAFLLQAASLEAELGNVLKEYDRVTRNITDFNAERHKYQQQLLTVTHENRHLDKLLADERLKHVAKDGHSMTLRKEFRQLMASAKVEHQRALERELLQRQQLERDLWEIRRELDGKQWERIHQGVQTHYVIT